MIRLILTAFACFAVVLPASALDVHFADPMGKEFEVRGADVDEAPDGITIKKANSSFEITYNRPPMRVPLKVAKPVRLTYPIKVPAANVKDYLPSPDDVAPADHLAYRGPLSKVDIANINPTFTAQRRMQEYTEALPLFQKVIPQVDPKRAPKARRHIEYRYGQTLFRMASSDAKQRDKALEVLSKFAQEYADGWQIVPALTMLASLQEDAGDSEGVRKTYEQLAAVPGVAEDVRIDSLLRSAGTLIKTEKYAAARTQLQELRTKLAGDSPHKSKVEVYLAQCQVLGDNAAEAKQAEQQLRGMLASSDDKALKALAHNTLGDYYRKLKQDEDAFWEYLRVDTLYKDDRFEHARAMYHLIQLFREVKKDADRSDSYFEELTTNPRYAGLEYTKKAMKK